MPAPDGCAPAPRIAAAFAEDAVVRPLEAGAVEAVLREPADRSGAVLGLHNPSAVEARVDLGALLPELAGRTWHFVSGSMHTSAAPGGLYVHLPASGQVWLSVTS